MATIRKRNGKFQVQIRRQGSESYSKTFRRRQDALAWAREMEVAADRSLLEFDPRSLEKIFLRDLVARYRDEVSPGKKSREVETIILNAFLREPMCKKSLRKLSNADFAAYRDRELKNVKPATLNRRLSILNHMFEIARIEWGVQVPSNPVASIRKPKNGPHRDRRLKAGEFERLMAACKQCRNPHIKPIIILAVETAMRRGEILAIRMRDIDFERERLHIPISKNGRSRVIPLPSIAKSILENSATDMRAGEAEVFPVSANALRLSWERIRNRAGLPDLHFHDLRHEAVSRLFEQGKTMPEIAAISGHRDFRMLARYAHVRLSV